MAKQIKKSDLLARVKKCIDKKIAPYIQMDGGDIEIIELTPKKILKVRLRGACMGCAMAGYTLQYGVQNTISEEFPDEDIQVLLVE